MNNVYVCRTQKCFVSCGELVCSNTAVLQVRITHNYVKLAVGDYDMAEYLNQKYHS